MDHQILVSTCHGYSWEPISQGSKYEFLVTKYLWIRVWVTHGSTHAHPWLSAFLVLFCHSCQTQKPETDQNCSYLTFTWWQHYLSAFLVIWPLLNHFQTWCWLNYAFPLANFATLTSHLLTTQQLFFCVGMESVIETPLRF